MQKLDPKTVRENVEIHYRLMNPGQSNEVVDKYVDKEMAVWLHANISLLDSTEFSLDEFSADDLKMMMNEFAMPEIENYEASEVIKNYLVSKGINTLS